LRVVIIEGRNARLVLSEDHKRAEVVALDAPQGGKLQTAPGPYVPDPDSTWIPSCSALSTSA